ncbi:hypothetical protein K438DRAFT_1992928 [Mycena galopus ATCC 62051]|nr:hypothetical protein K438DRAFT_1992928 [Mycena galopus ATCC 62051]
MSILDGNQPIAANSLPDLHVELWDLIFHHLGSNSLLTVAGVCRGFNELAIPLYLLKHGVSAVSIQQGNLDIPCDVISALLLSFSSPPVKIVRCTFSGTTGRMHRKLCLLRAIVSTVSSLRELHVEFPSGFFTTFGSYLDADKKAVLDALRDVLYAVCMKIHGTVVMLHNQQLLRYSLPDVCGWRLPQLSASPPLHPSLRLRVETGSADFSSVSMLKVTSLLGSSTVIVPHPPIFALNLGGYGWGAQNALTSAEITALLPHLSFPRLQTLRIETASIDPGALGAFLLRHSEISCLSYEPSEGFDSIPSSLTHPSHTRGSGNYSVTASPLLSEFAFPYSRDSASGITAKSTIRHITTRTSQLESGLTIHLRIDGRNTRALDAGEQSLARALLKVHHIRIECRSFESAWTMFPWLVLLPALWKVEFRYMKKRPGLELAAQMAQFLKDARSKLPHVAEVNVWDVY